jgi:DNA-directed RNA polymerase specialized sigma24 family protein
MTPDQQEAILDSLRVGVILADAAKASGLTVAAVRAYAATDDDFATALDAAEAEGAAERGKAPEQPPPPPEAGPPLPREKLAALRDLIARLPAAQQEALIAGMPIDKARGEAVAKALRSHPEAAADVAKALRGLP